MPGEIDLPIPDAGSLTRGRFTYFPVVPGRLEFALEVRAAILRDRPEVVALELPVTLQAAWMRAVSRLPEISVIVYPDEDGGEDQAVYVPIEPSDPFTEAIRTGLEVGAEIVFADPDAGLRPHLKDAYPDPYAVRHIGSGRRPPSPPQGRLSGPVRGAPHRAGSVYRGVPRLSAGAFGRTLAPRRRDRLETAGRQPFRQSPGRDLAEPARRGAGRYAGAASAAPGAPGPRRRRTAQPASRVAGRDSARIPRASVALRDVSRTDDRCQPDRSPACATRRLARRRKGVRGQYRRAHRPLAAPPAGPLHAQSRPGRQRSVGRHLRSRRGRPRYRRRQLRLGCLGGRRALSAAAHGERSRHGAHLRRRGLDRHAPHPAAPPPAQYQAETAPLWTQATQEGEVSRRMGQPVEWRRDLLVSPGRPDHRGLRTLPQEEGQEHSLRGTRARGAVHHPDSGWHRPSRDHPQVVRKAHLRAPVPEDLWRGGQHRGDLRRGSR